MGKGGFGAKGADWGPKGGGKRGGGAEQHWDEDELSTAVTQACAPILHLETEWDQSKLEKRIRMYFKNAAKSLEFDSKPWNILIQEYTDLVFGSLFQALKDREWLGQIDLLMVVDAAVKELFPPYLFDRVPQNLFERTVLSAHDRAFEEQRFAPMLWEVLFEKIAEKSAKNTVYKAFEAGRKEAANLCKGDSRNPVEDFVSAWVACSIGAIRDEGFSPEDCLPLNLALEVFHALLEAGALPLPLTQEYGPPPLGWDFLDSVIQDTYTGKLKKPKPPVGGGRSTTTWAPTGGGKNQQAPGKSWGKGKGGAQQWKEPPSWKGKSEKGGGKFEKGKGASDAMQPPVKRAKLEETGPKTKGHPLCTQKEDCIGTPDSALVQHVDGEVGGDVYCCACWAVFADADPSLNAVPYDPQYAGLPI